MDTQVYDGCSEYSVKQHEPLMNGVN